MNALRACAALAFRVMGFATFGLVLLFPAWKGVWLGYVPVLLGLAAAWMLRRGVRRGDFSACERWSGALWIAVAYLAPAMLQVGLLLALRPAPQFDGQFVFAEAVELARTGRLSELTYYPPLQTWWYAGWFKLFGASALVAQLSHVPLAALVTFLTHRVARCAGLPQARLAALLVAYYPSFVAYVLVTPYYHYLYTAAVVATVWGWLASTPRVSGAMGAGVASGLGALAKATQLIAPVQALVFWLLAPRDQEPPAGQRSPMTGTVLRLGLFVLGMAAVVAPWTARNYRVFDAFVPVCTSGGLVLHSANNPESNGLYSGLPDATPIDSPKAMLAHSRASAEEANRFMRERPAAFLRLAWNKVLHTWGGEATFAELVNRRGRPLGRLEDAFSVAFFAGWSCVAALWAAFAWTALRARSPMSAIELACAIVVGSNAVVYAVFEGGDRHHLPLVPLIVLASWAAASASSRQTT